MGPDAQAAPRRPTVPRVHRAVAAVLDGADGLIYGLVGLVFLAAAAGMLGYRVLAFPDTLARAGFRLAIITLVNGLLLVMIIMEVLRTVLSYLAERGTSLRPFLFIATRRILAIGAQMSVAGERLTPDQFRQAMVDLGTNAAVILALAVALFLLDRRDATAVPAPPRGPRGSPGP